MLTDEENKLNKAVALKLAAELNRALGIPEDCDQVPAPPPIYDKAEFAAKLRATVASFYKLREAVTATTLHAAVWAKRKTTTWR